jgi:mannose-6-phosphate isomerase-like protein (cupin superfamily)
MRRTLCLSTLALLLSASVLAQTAPQKPVRSTAKPATAKPPTIAINVTDAVGAPLADTTVVTMTGVVSREGVTAADGSLQMINMRPGTYRLRFSREGSITLEREVVLRAGEAAAVDVALSPAPAPEEAPEPVAPPASTTLGPPGEPKVTPVPSFLERNFIGGREGRKDSVLGCTETGTATLHQLRDSWTAHSHDTAEEWIYVVAGEGTLRIGTADQKLQAGTFSLVPHTISHALVPQGRNPRLIISMLSGTPCNP